MQFVKVITYLLLGFTRANKTHYKLINIAEKRDVLRQQLVLRSQIDSVPYMVTVHHKTVKHLEATVIYLFVV